MSWKKDNVTRKLWGHRSHLKTAWDEDSLLQIRSTTSRFCSDFYNRSSLVLSFGDFDYYRLWSLRTRVSQANGSCSPQTIKITVIKKKSAVQDFQDYFLHRHLERGTRIQMMLISSHTKHYDLSTAVLRQQICMRIKSSPKPIYQKSEPWSQVHLSILRSGEVGEIFWISWATTRTTNSCLWIENERSMILLIFSAVAHRFYIESNTLLRIEGWCMFSLREIKYHRLIHYSK
jgi:hypothetical protein